MTYDSHQASKDKLALAQKILELVETEHHDDTEIQEDALWLAFQAFHRPSGAGDQLRRYGFICSHK